MALVENSVCGTGDDSNPSTAAAHESLLSCETPAEICDPALNRPANDALRPNEDEDLQQRALAPASSPSSDGGTELLGRPRAMSWAVTNPSIETVVSKAKRAASSLWLLLHAQVGFLV
jgi:hypothetical protein